MSQFFWFGKKIDRESLEDELNSINDRVSEGINCDLRLEIVLDSCEKLAVSISKEKERYLELLITEGSCLNDANSLLDDIISFCQRNNLLEKLNRELDGIDSFDLVKPNYTQNYFEGYAPLGVITHIAPTNAAAVAVLSVIEGLLAKNVNILKVSGSGLFAVKLLEQLSLVDHSGTLGKMVAVLPLSSRDESDSVVLAKLIGVSDGVSVWGGDESVKTIRNLLNPQTRFIPWGHKISFGYVSKKKVGDTSALIELAKDCIKNEQQSCSSPQTIFFETSRWDELISFAKMFSEILGVCSSGTSRPAPGISEQSEITNEKELLELKSIMDGECAVIESDNRRCRLFVENRSLLAASPLNRTVHIRPILPETILKALLPYRSYLQTAAVIADDFESVNLHQKLILAGVTRVTLPGKMLESYFGEPHDGEYALRRFCRRVRTESRLNGGRYSDYDYVLPSVNSDELPVMNKEMFSEQYKNLKAKLFFHSGGSSGKRTLSSFTYSDYKTQMLFAAEGLIAAGLDPKSDRVINLFFGGNLYGGLISFFTILENLGVCQFPMGAVFDAESVGEFIVEHDVNVLIGTPTYINMLLDKNIDRFVAYGKIDKIFYGGEHFTVGQRQWIETKFGIKHIVSASYGSVDAGPLGYQCLHCIGGEHHLHHKLHRLEILKMDADIPTVCGEIGRLVFTSFRRMGSKIERYDIGDLGRWVNSPCKCGKTAPKFELLGRHGDIFRVSSAYVNYNTIVALLVDANYAGEVQLLISRPRGIDKITVLLNKEKRPSVEIDLVTDIIKKYPILNELYLVERSIEIFIDYVSENDFTRTSSSAKTVHVIDRRIK